MQLLKVRDVNNPKRANTLDAGLDFFVPNKIDYTDFADLNDLSPNSDLKLELNEQGHILKVFIPPHCRIKIPSGIYVKDMPKNHAMLFLNKSGIAANKGVVLSACLVDEGYQGEIILCFINTGNHTIELVPGVKITQCIFVPIARPEFEVIDASNLEIHSPYTMEDVVNTFYLDAKSKDSRGDGGFGSSGE